MSLRTALRLVLAPLLVITLVGPAAAQVAVAPMPRAKPTREIRLGLSVGGPQVVQVQYEYRRLDMPVVAPMPRVAPETPRDDFDPVIEEIVLGRPAYYPAQGAAVPAPPHCAFDRCAQPTQQVAQSNPPCYDIARQAVINPFPLPWTNGTRVAQHLATCDGMSFTWQYNPPCVPPMPRGIVEIIGEFDHGFRANEHGGMLFGPTFRAAPAMIPPRPLPASTHPLVEFRAIRCDGNECWWVEPVRMPMPRPMTHAHQFTCVGPGQIQCVEVRGHQTGVVVGGPAPCCQNPAAKAECCPVPTATHPVVLRQIGMQPAQPALTKCLAETWYRDLDGIILSATFSGSEMTFRMTQCAEGATVVFILTADFAITKEGVVHGIVTGVDMDVQQASGKSGAMLTGLALAQTMVELQRVVDTPFSFRVKQTANGMMVTNLKTAMEGMGGKELSLACGMYKLAPDGRVPAAKPMSTWLGGTTKCDSGHCDAPVSTPPVVPVSSVAPQSAPHMPMPTPPGEVIPVNERSEQLRKVMGAEVCQGDMTLPGGRYLQHYPQYFTPDPQHPLPRELANREDPEGAARRYGASQTVCPPVLATGPAPMLCPPKPANVPVSEFGMMAEVFGQMVGQTSGQCKAPPVSTYPVQSAGMMYPVPMAYPTPMAMPMPMPSAGMAYPVPMAYPAAMPMPMTVPPSVPMSPVFGTWYREVGPRMCVMKIEQDHLTLSFTESEDVGNGKTAAAGVTMTCDYHLSRDGVTAVGLITSVDAVVEGDMPDDSVKDLLGFVAAFQKACEEKPFALTLRPYGDSLVVGNVRMPELGEDVEIQPSSMFGGRFKNAGNKPVPKAKPKKDVTTNAAPKPSGPTIVSGPVIVEGIPLDNPQINKAQPPTLTGPIEKSKILRKGTKQSVYPMLLNVYSSDPNVPIDQLLYQSEDLRQLNNEWRRFWFNDQPKHLTPEHIHGGIR